MWSAGLLCFDSVSCRRQLGSVEGAETAAVEQFVGCEGVGGGRGDGEGEINEVRRRRRRERPAGFDGFSLAVQPKV